MDVYEQACITDPKKGVEVNITQASREWARVNNILFQY